MNTFNLTYQNEDDRAYGLAGMAISLAALDALDNVVFVSLDSDGPMVHFTHSYYLCGSPVLSPKAVWANMVNNFNLTSAMVLSNVMARSIVRMGQEVPEEIMSELRREMVREGRDSCSLDEDEVTQLYNRARNYLRRIFHNERLHPAIDELVRTLCRRRTMSGSEIADELHLLQIL